MAHTAEIESRTTAAKVELRTAPGGARRIGGYASRFDQVSEPLPFREVVDRRFFSRSESEGFAGVVARFEHSNLHLLGSVASGSLRLNVDDAGLNYVVDLPTTAAGDDTYTLVSRGDVAYSSMAFIVDSADGDSWDYRDGTPMRTLLSGKVVDIAPVSQPAYRSTDCALRSLSRAVDAEYADVVLRAESDRLAEFFTRSDRGSSQPMSGRTAVLKTLEKRWPAAPSGDNRSQPMSGRHAVLRTLEARWPKPRALTPRQRQVELLGRKWGPQ
jgi:HK97 family phage prohead protease